jgi:tetratricopeptide (TPR) repeat protein
MEFGPFDKAESKANRAFELYEDGKMAQALEEIETALELNPTNSCWHFDKALALDAVHRYEEAIEEYEAALQLSAGDLEILNSLAVDYTRTGQYDRAIETFEQIQHLDPRFEPSYCNRIIAYTEMGLHDLAEQMFYLAQQINPCCALCFYNIGNSLYVRGEYKKAIGCWSHTAEIEPSHPQINYRIAQAYWSLDERAQAHEHFLRELRANPGDVEVILDFGVFLLETGDLESAKEKFHRLLEFAPHHPLALFHLAEMAFHQGDLDGATDLYNQALRSDGTLAGPYYRLAQMALRRDQKQKARAYLISELRNAPDNAEVLVSVASMFLAVASSVPAEAQPWPAGLRRPPLRSAFGSSDLDHASHCLMRAMEVDGSNAEAHYYLGVISALKGLFRESEGFFSQALQIKSDHIPTLRESAWLHLQEGRFSDALQRIGQARVHGSDDASVRELDRRIRFQAAWAKTRSWVQALVPTAWRRSPQTK